MGGRIKSLLAAAVAAVLLAGVAACGGADGDTVVQATDGSGGGAGNQGAEGGRKREGGAAGSDASRGDQDSGAGDDRRGGRDSDDPGGSSEFAVPGGDNSVQSFGSESDDAELEEVSDTVEAFMEARAARNWEGMCDHLAATVIEPIQKLVENNPKFKGAGCAELLAAIGKQAKDLANNMAEPVGSFRVEGSKGYALYHGTGGEDFVVPMNLEGDAWKVAVIEPAPLA
jgi:hypothetical protein